MDEICYELYILIVILKETIKLLIIGTDWKQNYEIVEY